MKKGRLFQGFDDDSFRQAWKNVYGRKNNLKFVKYKAKDPNDRRRKIFIDETWAGKKLVSRFINGALEISAPKKPKKRK